MNTVFGLADIPAVFARYRKPFIYKGITKRNVLELIDAGTELILEGLLQKSPHNEKMMGVAYASRNLTSGKN